MTRAAVLPRADFLHALRASSDESGSGEYSIFLELDIHHLDWINQAFGVEAGDRAIEHVGNILLEVIGDEGIVGRIDGDEFGILLSTFSRLEAMELARQAIERAKRALPPRGPPGSRGRARRPERGDAGRRSGVRDAASRVPCARSGQGIGDQPPRVLVSGERPATICTG